jgi:hypothetical protein
MDQEMKNCDKREHLIQLKYFRETLEQELSKNQDNDLNSIRKELENCHKRKHLMELKYFRETLEQELSKNQEINLI